MMVFPTTTRHGAANVTKGETAMTVRTTSDKLGLVSTPFFTTAMKLFRTSRTLFEATTFPE